MRSPYTPQPRQLVFHQSKADEILYGGQAGGGKSYALRWDAIDFCINLPGFFAGVFRETMPMLEENHVTFIREELGQLEAAYSQKIGTFNETRKKVEFANGSILRFKHLEYDKDVNDIHGWELNGAYIDEGAQMSPYRLAYVKSRIRVGQKLLQWKEMAKTVPSMLPFIERTPRFCIGSNPGGMSHHYLKETFIDPAPPETPFEFTTKRGTKKTRIFIPAGMRDNRYLDENYEDQFDDLPEWQQKQLRDGDWDVVPGAFFDCWSPQNVIKPFQVPDHWTRIIGVDWGFGSPFWIGEFVVSDGTPVTTKDKREVTYPAECLILVWEWYGHSGANKGIRMDARLVAQKLGERPKPTVAVGDESMWNHHDAGPSPAEKFASEGVYLARADRDRVLGWQELYSRIKHNMLLAFDTCRDFVRTLPAVQTDQNKPEDVDKKGEDHCFSADTEILIRGDTVFSMGRWRKFRSPRIIRRNALLLRLSFNDGSEIKCTPDHRFWTTSGWVEARHLNQKTLPVSLPQSRFSEDCRTTFAAITSCAHGGAKESGAKSDYIGQSGFTIMGLFQKVTAYITKTVIEPITLSPIFASCFSGSTRSNTPTSESLTARFSIQENWRERKLLNGIEAKKAASGTASIQSDYGKSLRLNVFQRTVRYARSLIQSCRFMLASRSIAATTAKQLHCVGVEELSRDDVYCLTVPSVGAFTLTNGVTVSNCVDGARYVCMSRPFKTVKAPKKPDWWTVPQTYTFDQIRTMREKPKSWSPEII